MCSGVRCYCCFAMWQQHFGPSPNCAVRARLQRHLPYPIAFHSLSLSSPLSLFVCVCVFAFGLAKCANGMTPISIWCSPLFRVHQLQLLLTHLSCLSAARTAPAVCVCCACVCMCVPVWESQTLRPFCYWPGPTKQDAKLVGNLNNWPNLACNLQARELKSASECLHCAKSSWYLAVAYIKWNKVPF